MRDPALFALCVVFLAVMAALAVAFVLVALFGWQ